MSARFEVVPRIERDSGVDEVVAWEVWRDREEIRPGVWTGDWLDTFDNETDAIDARAHYAAASS